MVEGCSEFVLIYDYHPPYRSWMNEVDTCPAGIAHVASHPCLKSHEATDNS